MYENIKRITDFNIFHKRVILRADYNVPISNGNITDDKRIVSSIPTINFLIKNDCSIVILSHFSRIKNINDIKSNKKTLYPVAKKLQSILPDCNVKFEQSIDFNAIYKSVMSLKNKEILLLENTRYYDIDASGNYVQHESKNDKHLAKFWAGLGEIFVNDAFGTAHRAHASNAGIASFNKNSCIGFLMDNEITKISKAINNPNRPFVVVLGGSKVNDKIKIIKNLLEKADKLIITGGMAYTFLRAIGYDIGNSLCDTDSISIAKEILNAGKSKIVLTSDSICSNEFADVPGKVCKLNEYGNLQALDIGPDSIHTFKEILNKAKTVVWNGPCGVFEFGNYKSGTLEIIKKIREISLNGCYSLIGGGDSAAAINLLEFSESDFGFVSTGGGACLAMLEGSPLVGIENISCK